MTLVSKKVNTFFNSKTWKALVLVLQQFYLIFVLFSWRCENDRKMSYKPCIGCKLNTGSTSNSSKY